jgi:hypothetical protein
MLPKPLRTTFHEYTPSPVSLWAASPENIIRMSIAKQVEKYQGDRFLYLPLRPLRPLRLFFSFTLRLIFAHEIRHPTVRPARSAASRLALA